MKRMVTPNGYLVIENIAGLDVYRDDTCLVCELFGKSFANFTYDNKVDGDKLDKAIEDELGTLEVLEKITDPFNVL